MHSLIASLFIITIWIASNALAGETGTQNYNKDLHIQALKNSYISYELVKNSPIIHTQEKLIGRHVTPYFGYRKLINNHWLMGVGLNFKSFTKQTNQELAFMTLQHEALYVYPISYPLYMMFGPKILYLLPTQHSFLPILSDPEFNTEIGAGASMMLALILNDDLLLSIRVDRWRGTKTDLFHGVEVGLGVNYKL